MKPFVRDKLSLSTEQLILPLVATLALSAALAVCDSIVTLNLTVNPTVTTALNQSICIGQSYSFYGNTYTTAGTYTANLLTSNGCDSVVTLNLTVSPAITSTVNEAICQGQTFAFNGTTYSTAGSYTGTFSSAGGLR